MLQGGAIIRNYQKLSVQNFLDTQVSLAPTHVQYNLHEPSYNLPETGYNLHELGYNLHELGYNLHSFTL